MFEFDKYDHRLHTAPPETPDKPYEFATGIERASLLVWGEHCIECAAPACYQSCTLYDPRRDGACRRFEYGFAQNRNFQSYRGYGTEIVFKKWGKLEAPGNSSLVSRSRLDLAERLLGAPVSVVNGLGTLIWRATGKTLFPRLSYSLLESYVRKVHRKKPAEMPDAFLMEIYNPNAETVQLQLNIWSKVDIGNRPPPYIERVEIPPGYYRRDVPVASFAHIIGSGEPFNVSITPEGDSTPHLVLLSLDFVVFKKAAGANAKSKAAKPAAKCVVFDLDNTLWDGVLLEDSNVVLRPNAVKIIKELDKRGILLSIASKNPFDLAWSKLEEFGLQEYFLHPYINWVPKSQNIQAIAKKLNIGLDTFVFIDDSDFEREEVSAMLPMVETLDAIRDFDSLLELDRLRGSSSSEAKNRRRFYLEAEQRESVMADFSDYVEYLRSCEITLEIRPYTDADRQRSEELVQRTNQLNFSGKKYTREQFSEIIADRSLEKSVLSCSDKFGSYGTIGFCVWRRLPDMLEIEDLMLSCRIQGKFLEQALFKSLLELHSASMLKVNFRSTDRNAAARGVMMEMGLNEVPDGFVRNTADCPIECDFIKVMLPELVTD